ncbi:hypothetical protein [Ponticaulis profundi]|uniref:Uncharacterized protein n=1 Tax=Ponticaulis profundi TaxID=2665222 RepID=A0ABW1SC62_9PROT
MKSLQEITAELRKRSPIDAAEFSRMSGPVLSVSLIRLALESISGKEGWDGYRYYCDVIERCGCHPEEGASESLMLAYEKARQLVVAEPKNRVELDAMLEQEAL